MIPILFVWFTACKEKTKETVAVLENQVTLAQKIDGLVKDYEDLDIFSGIVLVAEKGDPIYHKAFGLADREIKIANTTTTLFDIGSMNKTFTSVVIKQLIDEGKLEYRSKLTAFIQGFKDPMVNIIEVEHLLNHESGFGDYHDDAYFDLPKSEKTLHKIVERAKQTELFFEPGEEQEYSNTGYVLLGALIEKVTGKSYFDNVKDRILSPLKMENTYIQDLDRFKDKVAYGYFHTPLGALEKNETLQDVPNPDGGFLSTTEDILKFYRSYYYDELLLNENIKSQDPDFQFIRSLEKGKAPLMAGGFEGFNTAMYQVISEDQSIIVFANMDEPVAEQIAYGILQILRGQQPEPAKLPAIQNVRIAFEDKGVAFVKRYFDDLTTHYHPEDPKDWILNDLGYAYWYGSDDIDKAISIFKLNTELFPKVPNTWDSLGEAYYTKGEKSRAKACYQKALGLDPELESAQAKLKMLD